jgi:NAD(P)H-hydrate epimerase
MAAADAAAVAAGTPVEVLMERAGRAVAWQARQMLGGTYGRRVVAVCGKGNNGGDGMIAARVLRAAGVRVDVFDLAAGVEVPLLLRALHRADLAIDAMFGTGLHGPLEGDTGVVASALVETDGPVLAVDIPSGVDGATGAIPGGAVAADATVCFAALKAGLVLLPGAARAGDVHVVDIGIALPDTALHVATANDIAAWLPIRPLETHKWDAGGVLVVGGSGGMTGAALLASRAALRAGAGIVVCGLPGPGAAMRASGSEVITRALPATPDGALVDVPTEGVERFAAVVLGPGLGNAAPTVAAVRRAIADLPRPLVLDADGLNALGGDLTPIAERRAATVVTPHDGEFARLTGQPPGDDRVGAARELAQHSGAVVVLKGTRTVVADPGGQAIINTTGGPALATAGTGDVLAGIIAAFVARGIPVFEAAAAAAWVHGRAVPSSHAVGLVAGDVVEALPHILTRLQEVD